MGMEANCSVRFGTFAKNILMKEAMKREFKNGTRRSME
jgi:hypothetical protein